MHDYVNKIFFLLYSEGGFVSSVVHPSSSSSVNGLAVNGRSLLNYVDDDMSSSIYDIPAYDTESSLVLKISKIWVYNYNIVVITKILYF